MDRQQPNFRILLLTSAAMIAFALNSILCRLALKESEIAANAFTGIRLGAGTLTLLLLILFNTRGRVKLLEGGSWKAGGALCLYAVAFSLAYLELETATGALILFTAVQVTMIVGAILQGHRLGKQEILGTLLAFAGFVYLLSPGLNRPGLWGSIAMTASGIGWGIYSLLGKGSEQPIRDTGANFLRAFVFCLLFVLVWQAFKSDGSQFSYDQKGFFLAAVSGSITSGLGYVLWYAALKGLSGIQASVVQLIVPVLAALGGVLWVEESIGLRLMLAGIVILTGIFIVIMAKASTKGTATNNKTTKNKSTKASASSDDA